MRLLHNPKWTGAGLLAIALLLAAAPIAYGGGRWRGIDPELVINGHKANIVIAVPPGTWCEIDKAIRVSVLVPDLDQAFFVSESTGEIMPGRSYHSNPDHTKCGAYTVTTLGEHDGKPDAIYVSAYVGSDKRRTPVDITISVDGVERLVCSGKSNAAVQCDPVYLSGDKVYQGNKAPAKGKDRPGKHQ